MSPPFFKFLNNYCQTYSLVLLIFCFGCVIPFTQSSISVNGSQTGIYGDTGRDQTAWSRFSDGVEKVVKSYDKLDTLGLPKHARGKNNTSSLRKSAPQFLLEIYKRLQAEDNNDEPGSPVRSRRDLQYQENFITDGDEKAIAQSSTIMTFLSKNRYIDKVGHEKGRRLWFNIANAPAGNNLIMAGLRVFQNLSLATLSTTDKEFIITVYAIVKKKGQEKELIFLSSIYTTIGYQGWLELNVTDGLKFWLQDRKRNRGIHIKAHAVGKPDTEVSLHGIGLVHSKVDDDYQTFMVGFFRGPELLNAEQNHSRHKRTISTLFGGPTTSTSSCQKEPLHVTFKDLGWDDWIIAPKSYDAFQCSGECILPIADTINSSIHATIQGLLHSKGAKISAPCCVPSQLGAISVVYYDDSDNVNLKKFKDMFVKSCICS